MILFTDVKRPDGSVQDFLAPSEREERLDGSHLTLLPGLIDPHVHFRTPGMEHKENWVTAARAALRGGYTTVFDMPNTIPPTITADALQAKQQLIDAQLREAGIPLRYQLFFGADKHHLNQIPGVASSVVGIKVFMGCSTGNLVIDDDESLHAVFEIAAACRLLVAVHAEDEMMIQARKSSHAGRTDYACHSSVRNPDVAARAVEKAIALTRRYGTRLYILHVSTEEEIALIRNAKQANLPVFAETTPHHLFLDTSAYAALFGKAVVNPPLREAFHRHAVMTAIKEGIIDTIGSDHAPHTEAEKSQPYGACPSGMPGIETTLPLLLTACQEGVLTLSQVISLTCDRPRAIFGVPHHDDFVLVDRGAARTVENRQLLTRCGWSAFAGQPLYGWPAYTGLQQKTFDLSVI